MGAAAAECGMDATWGRGCGEPRGGREGPVYIRAADPEEEGLADGPCTARPPGDGQEWPRGLGCI